MLFCFGAVLLFITDAHRRYWRNTLRLTSALLVLWFLVTFGIGFFARELNFRFFGWPFGFWVAAQGALMVYLGIVAVYAHTMDRWDRAYDVAEPEDE